MKYFFKNIKTITAELIGLFGGYIWARNTNWDYEPVILLVASGSAFFISMFLLIIGSKDPEIPLNSNTAVTVNETENSTITDIEPQAINQQIKNAPLFQQENIASHFIGLNVQWTLRLFLIHKREKNKISVIMKPLENNIIRVNFETDTDKHPIFKIAEDKKRFMISGKIISCTPYDIELKLNNLQVI